MTDKDVHLPNEEPNHLFAYGTLMCEEIMNEVSGRRLSHAPGTLAGYRRYSVRGEHYPGIVPEEGAHVHGVVYWDVPPAAWERLDRFEGDMYARQRVEIHLADGGTLSAMTYVVRPAFVDHLDPSEWDFEDFLRHGKASFQNHYTGYRSLESDDKTGTRQGFGRRLNQPGDPQDG